MENSGDVTYIKVKIQPRASKDEVCGLHNGALKVRLVSPPIDDRANKSCVDFFADLLGVYKGGVELVKGHRSRFKRIKVTTLTIKEIEYKFNLIFRK